MHECKPLGSGATCLGCDGAFGSGLIEDSCGVCGGNCSTCTTNQTGFAYNCTAPGLGWSGLDRTCELVRTAGPAAPDGNDFTFLNWTAAPDGRDAAGSKTSDTWWGGAG